MTRSPLRSPRVPRTARAFLYARSRTALAALVLVLASGCSAVQPQPAIDDLRREGMLALQRGDYEHAASAMERVIEADRESDEAAFARDTLRTIYGADLFPEPPLDCPKSAEDAWDEAERLFSALELRASLAYYEAAAAECPRSSAILRSRADAYYALGEYEQSSRMFREALGLDPWDRAAWRYLSDTERNIGDMQAAWEAATMAVLSDPLYEMGWVTLRSTSGLPFRRIRVDKPWVEKGENGPILHIASPDPRRPPADGDESPTLWMVYATASAHWDGADGKRLDAERERVRVTLNALERRRAEDAGAHSPFWDLVAEARSDGYLDEAIFLLLPDNDLAREYAAYRDDHRERLVTFVRTKLAPPFRGVD